ncbi:Haem peroxidase [Pseudonocardia sp. N23]|nr:Haem peroxidase [Pseudonocardia sp. N23]
MVPASRHATAVEEILAHLQGDAARTVLVSGLPGIGKSTTVGMVAGRLGRTRTVVQRAEADDLSRSRPFGLISGLLGIEAAYPPRPDTADRMVEAAEKLCAEGPVLLRLSRGVPGRLRSVDTRRASRGPARPRQRVRRTLTDSSDLTTETELHARHPDRDDLGDGPARPR